MNTKDFLKDIYKDFYGVETPKLEVSKEEVKEDSNTFMSDLFNDINSLYIDEESKNLLKKIIEYQRKYFEKKEKNYIRFNIMLETNDKTLMEKIKDILSKSSSQFEYTKTGSLVLSCFKTEEDVSKYYEEAGLVLLKDLKAVETNDTSFKNKFFYTLKEELVKESITIIAGTKDELENFINNGLRDYFELTIKEEAIEPVIIYNEIINENDIDDDLKLKLLDYVNNTFKTSDLPVSTYKSKLVEYISFHKSVPEYETNKTMDEIFKDLNDLVGLDNVKKSLHELVDLISLKSKIDLKISDINLHMVFLGNPGTGKTTVARILAEMLYNLKYVKQNKLIEVTSKDLVAEYVGQTAPKTNAVIEKALGGVLFIDEAYALADTSSGNSYNKEAIATLIAAMENHRSDLVVILAGYTKEMQDFLDTNSGITSRIGYTIEFKDYTEDELVEIFKGMVKKSGFEVTDDAILKLREVINEYKDSKNFGNARFVRNVFEKSIVKHASNTKDKKRKDILKTLTKEDISTDNLIKEI